MTAPYQVFVDGTRDRSPEAIARVAAAMATRYGLPPAELETRLARGRFKVKAGVDRATAESYARDLEQLGAICVVVDAAGKPVDFAAAAAAASPAVAKPRLGIPPPSTRGAPPPRAASGPLPPRPAGAAPARPVSSPLAGLTGNTAPSDLGALGRKDGAISLSSLDGDGDSEAIIEPTSLMAASFGPSTTPAPRTLTPASRAPTPAPVADDAAANKRGMTGPPVDLFAAPDAEAEVELALDVDLVAERAKKAASVPPPTSGAPSTFAGRRGTTAADLAPPAPVQRGPSLGERARDLLANARARFAAGVLAAVLIGFIPAHLVASIRESSEFAEVDSKLRDRFAAADSDEAYAGLDRARAAALDRKYAERREIALVAVLVWAAFGAGLAYVWFRRVPWDRIAPVQ